MIQDWEKETRQGLGQQMMQTTKQEWCQKNRALEKEDINRGADSKERKKTRGRIEGHQTANSTCLQSGCAEEGEGMRKREGDSIKFKTKGNTRAGGQLDSPGVEVRVKRERRV